jgi:hypothetical protein
MTAIYISIIMIMTCHISTRDIKIITNTHPQRRNQRFDFVVRRILSRRRVRVQYFPLNGKIA